MRRSRSAGARLRWRVAAVGLVAACTSVVPAGAAAAEPSARSALVVAGGEHGDHGDHGAPEKAESSEHSADEHAEHTADEHAEHTADEHAEHTADESPVPDPHADHGGGSEPEEHADEGGDHDSGGHGGAPDDVSGQTRASVLSGFGVLNAAVVGGAFLLRRRDRRTGKLQRNLPRNVSIPTRANPTGKGSAR